MLDMIRLVVKWIANGFRWSKATYLRLNGVRIGKNTMVSMGAKIDSHQGTVVIGDNCLITWGSVILSHDATAPMMYPGDDGGGTVVIGDNVFVGVNAVILRNVHIGSGSIIGAGAVVTRDVPPNSLVVGNPAQVVKSLALAAE